MLKRVLIRIGRWEFGGSVVRETGNGHTELPSE